MPPPPPCTVPRVQLFSSLPRFVFSAEKLGLGRQGAARLLVCLRAASPPRRSQRQTPAVTCRHSPVLGIDGLVLPEIASGCARACAGLSAQTRPSGSSCSASLMTGNCPPVPDGWRLFLQQEAWARCQGGGLGGSPLGAVPRAVGRQLTLVLPWGSGSSRAGSLCVPGVLEPAECPGRAGSRWPREVKAQETPGGEDYSWQLLFCQDCSGEAHP